MIYKLILMMCSSDDFTNILTLKPNYFKKQCFFTDMIHETSLLSTPLPRWISIIILGKKNVDEKTLLLK